MAPPAFREGLDGLRALTHFALMAAGADLIVAFEATADGLATPLAAAPATISDAFHLRSSRIFELDWSDGAPRDADTLRLPSILLHALGRPAQRCLFVATPVEDAPRSGLILLMQHALGAGPGDAHGQIRGLDMIETGVHQGVERLLQTRGHRHRIGVGIEHRRVAVGVDE